MQIVAVARVGPAHGGGNRRPAILAGAGAAVVAGPGPTRRRWHTAGQATKLFARRSHGGGRYGRRTAHSSC